MSEWAIAILVVIWFAGVIAWNVWKNWGDFR